MDGDEFKSILRKSGVDLWTFIDTAISVASIDYRDELKSRRDGIVEKLYTPAATGISSNYRNGIIHESPRHSNEIKEKGSSSPLTPQSIDGDDFEEQIFGSSIDEEQTKILAIKEHLEEPDQSEDVIVNLLQNLADMDITFKALKETDIGRHVNQFRKNPSSDVRRLVKQLVRKWKDLVDEWVLKSNTPGETAASTLIDEDSPVQNQLKSNQNGHHQHQVPDFAYSPNPHNGSSGSDKYNSEPERKVKTVPRREPPPQPKPSPSVPASSSAPIRQREQEKDLTDPEKLASATRRLHMNYKEAQNAKKQRTIQVMDIHDIPKPKNSFYGKNKGGFQAKHW